MSARRGPRSSDDATAEALEWEVLLGRVAAHAHGAPGRRRLLELRPATSDADAVGRARRLREADDAAADGEPLPSAAVDDVGDAIERVARGSVAAASELVGIRKALELAGRLRAMLTARPAAEALRVHLMTDEALGGLATELARVVADDGSVRDDASPALGAARRAVRSARSELTRQMDELAARHAEVLQDGRWQERDGRWVLPIRSDAHYRVPGVVVDSSASGATLWVEPSDAARAAGRLRAAEGDAIREEAKVLAAASAAVASQARAVRGAFEACVEADVIGAAVRWGRSVGARPVSVDPALDIQLASLRHPLLLGVVDPVIASDIQLERGRVLVLSGPNAGGKTAALEAVGLAIWAARSGLPVPCDPAASHVGRVRHVLADVGDEQSLERGLSSFTGHLARLHEMLAAAGRDTLLLVDEIASGTDPEEGAALAIALCESMADAGAFALVTTHYERLKERAASDKRFRNASVGFDVEAMRPTFRVHLDVPGPSLALAVAERQGSPAAVVARARVLLPVDSLAREAVVQQLSRETERVRALRAELEIEVEKARREREIAERQRERAREVEQAKLVREAEELRALVREARAAVERAKKQVRAGELREAERGIDGAARLVSIEGALTAATRGPAPPALATDALRPGARVKLRTNGMMGEVLERLDDERLRVRVGALKLVVTGSDLAPVDDHGRPLAAKGAAPRPPAAAPAGRRGQRAEAVAMSDGFVPSRTTDNTLDLRGKTVDEALGEVDVFLDRLLRDEERAGFVLHGHGTGALKAAVRRHLRAHPRVAQAEPCALEDGGDAFTLVVPRF